MTEWKVISTKSPTQFEVDLNAAMKQGYTVVSLIVMQGVAEPFVAVLNRQTAELPDAKTALGHYSQ